MSSASPEQPPTAETPTNRHADLGSYLTTTYALHRGSRHWLSSALGRFPDVTQREDRAYVAEHILHDTLAMLAQDGMDVPTILADQLAAWHQEEDTTPVLYEVAPADLHRACLALVTMWDTYRDPVGILTPDDQTTIKQIWGVFAESGEYDPLPATSAADDEPTDPRCPRCGEQCAVITRGDSGGTEISACCEGPIELTSAQEDGTLAVNLHAVRAGLLDLPEDGRAAHLIGDALTTFTGDRWESILHRAVERAERLTYDSRNAEVTVEGLPHQG
ncbi:hypothetical protein [Nonomuraea sp. SYSU D8015]|uniref:hypothetical protein n=1 Tax=Nonomuraea sp. SYSU D8015 TaxID=2593644 RepID=UPI001660E233|nr:hypothetical protein [Nonomuraea sp. SYSU D8015]